jgi:thiol:disulfide interchange protein
MRHTLALPVLALAIAFPAATAVGQSQDPLRSNPQEKEEQVDQKAKKKREAIYDESADAKEQIAAALVKARKENRRVLIQWGANWCGWCHLLHDLCKSDRQLRRELQYEYDVVLVDIGRWDKNVDLTERYGVDFKKHGVPYLTVLDADGSVLVNRETGSLEAGSKHDPAKVLAFLRENRAPYLSADSVLSEGLAKAKEEGKRVFLHFGAPWCGWCHRLEDWIAREDVTRILGKYFVDVKIDIDRTIGGQDLIKHYSKGQSNGLPWFAVVDARGEVLVTSNYPTNNLGYPYQPEEIEAFGQMLAKGSIRITDKDIAALKESLAEARQEIERRKAERRRSGSR